MQIAYFFSLFPALLTIFGNLVGGIWSAANIVFLFGIMVVLDLFSPERDSPNANKSDAIPTFILILHPLAHTMAIVSLFYGIYSGTLHGYWIWIATLSTGINSGLSGIISAHELIHRREKWAKFLGIWNLFFVNYGHYYIEHIRVHHRYVATRRDAATAYRGESLYRFFLRTVSQQFWSAFQFEKKTKGVFNFVFWITFAQIVFTALVGVVFGPFYLGVYLLNSVLAFLLLEYANYVEHYGLSREESAPMKPENSWQSNSLATRFTLMELSRHSDHHLRASKKYHALDSVAGTPEMPYGYFGMFYIALIPPLWFKIVDPIIANRKWEK